MVIRGFVVGIAVSDRCITWRLVHHFLEVNIIFLSLYLSTKGEDHLRALRAKNMGRTKLRILRIGEDVMLGAQ